jgi:hypothetical protein
MAGRKKSSYDAKYGATDGEKLLHALQSASAHASVSAKRKKKIAQLKAENARLKARP